MSCVSGDWLSSVLASSSLPLGELPQPRTVQEDHLIFSLTPYYTQPIQRGGYSKHLQLWIFSFSTSLANSLLQKGRCGMQAMAHSQISIMRFWNSCCKEHMLPEMYKHLQYRRRCSGPHPSSSRLLLLRFNVSCEKILQCDWTTLYRVVGHGLHT